MNCEIYIDDEWVACNIESYRAAPIRVAAPLGGEYFEPQKQYQYKLITQYSFIGEYPIKFSDGKIKKFIAEKLTVDGMLGNITG
jgi:hypothetical protein